MGIINTLPLNKSALSKPFGYFSMIRAIQERKRNAPHLRFYTKRFLIRQGFNAVRAARVL